MRQRDQIYLLERGEVKVKGTFEELTQANERSQKKNGGVTLITTEAITC